MGIQDVYGKIEWTLIVVICLAHNIMDDCLTCLSGGHSNIIVHYNLHETWCKVWETMYLNEGGGVTTEES